MVDTKKKLLFQSTLPREERPLVCFCSSDYWYFNPRSHERSDLQIFKTYLLITYFNPRSHERSDLAYSTSSASYSFYFNPRSHERSDAGVVGIAIGVVNFNPRSHERSDKNPQAVANNSNISIHAPTRGATRLRILLGTKFCNFNPRSHERSDSNIAQKICLFLYNTDNKYIIR